MNTRHVRIQQGSRRAWVYPEQGFQLHGFEQDLSDGRGVARVIYVPDAMATEPWDRRYGNPVLFPSPSRSQTPEAGADSWKAPDGRILPMPFHGFARDLYWQVTDIQTDRITALLKPEGVARLCFPFDYELRLTYRLGDAGLTLETELTNRGEEPFPYSLGFHPYLRVPLGPQGAIGDASVPLPACSRVRSENGAYRREAQEARRLRADDELVGSILLTDVPTPYLELEDAASGLTARVSVETSEQSFPFWVIWSASPESPYICLEPWSDLPNALNRPDTCRRCAPGETHGYRLVLSVRETG